MPKKTVPKYSPDPCIHEIWPSECCTICNGKDRRDSEVPDIVGTPVVATMTGECFHCGEDINVGDSIFFVLVRERKKRIHELCGKDM